MEHEQPDAAQARTLKYEGIIFWSLVLLIVIYVIGALIPTLTPDGREELEKIASTESVSKIMDDNWSGIDRLSGSKPGGIFGKTIVERIEYTPEGHYTSRDDIRAYTVTTRTIGLFGRTIRKCAHTAPYPYCQRVGI